MCRSGLRHCRASHSREHVDLENAKARVARNIQRGSQASAAGDDAAVAKYAALRARAEEDVARITGAAADSAATQEPEATERPVAHEANPADGPWETVEETARGLEARYPGVKFSLFERASGHVVVSKISVEKELRGQGLAANAMRDLIEQADAKGWPMALTASNDFGASKTRLKSWYSSLGFIQNKGRNRDFSIMEDMIRPPRGN